CQQKNAPPTFETESKQRSLFDFLKPFINNLLSPKRETSVARRLLRSQHVQSYSFPCQRSKTHHNHDLSASHLHDHCAVDCLVSERRGRTGSRHREPSRVGQERIRASGGR